VTDSGGDRARVGQRSCDGADAWARARHPDVSVTLVLYNSDDHLRACLAALRGDLDTGIAELIAVDNASPDGSARITEEAVPWARLIRSPVNRGFAGACNLAWPAVGGRYWLLLNPDVVLDPGALEELVRWMDSHPDVGVASPWLRDATTAEPSYPGRSFPSVSRTLFELLRLHLLLPARLRGELLQGPYVKSVATSTTQPDWVPGAAMMVRSAAVDEVGLLDESFFLYGEDLEWCWRTRSAGWRIATCPTAVATHHAGASSRRTWSDEEVGKRTATGVAKACRLVRGRPYARLYALLTVLALSLEAWHPGRAPEARRRAAAARRAWLRTLQHL
jgi:N-acetylglucosaminyl-diphospho-decaprenol L-rhamnosyltransferase